MKYVSLGLCIGLIACGGENPVDDAFDRQAMLTELGANVFVPTYEDAAAAALDFDTAARAYCGAPSEAGLSEVEAAYRNAHLAYKHAESFALGPHTDRPERFGPLIDDWPAEENDIREMLAGTDDLSTAAFAMRGNRTQGFAATDYLLFGDDLGDWAGRRCEYLTGLSGRLRDVSAQYVDAWRADGGDHVGELSRGEGRYGTVFIAASLLVEQMKFSAENVRELKVGKPFGKRDAGRLQPDQFEVPYGRGSLAAAIASIESVESVYLGRYTSRDGTVRDGLGIQDWVRSFRPDVDELVLADLAAALAALRAVTPDLEGAIESDPEAVEAAYQAVKDLETTIAVEMAMTVSVTVTFNPTDGD